MFTQRLIAICLLVVYGLPASIGPHWHRHDSGCADCISAFSDGHCGDCAEDDCGANPGGSGEGHASHGSCDQASDQPGKHGADQHPEAQYVAASEISGEHVDDALADGCSAQDLPIHGLAVRGVADHGACSVCQFYAQSSLVNVGFSIEACEAIVTQQSPRSVSVFSEPQLLLAVRGPPLLSF